MNPAPIPATEAARLKSLRGLQVLDTAIEAKYEALAEIASLVCGVPISLISLVDADRQWFKANIGLPGITETPRDLAFCAHAIQGDNLFIVGDAREDPRFSDNPLVTGDPNIRFYAGVPLKLDDGQRVGTLCVIDRQPRELTDTQQRILRHLSFVAVKALETRKHEQRLAEERARLAFVLDASLAATWEFNVQTREVLVGDRWYAMIGENREDLDPDPHQAWADQLHPDDLARSNAIMEDHLAGTRDSYDCEVRVRRRGESWLWIRGQGRIMTWTPDGRPEWVYGALSDISEQKAREEALRWSRESLDRTGRVAGVGGWELDLRDGSILWSDETCRIHGTALGHQPKLDEVIEFYLPESRDRIRAAIDEAVATGLGWDMELQAIRADGRQIWVRSVGAPDFESGAPVRLVGAVQDISARISVEMALKRAAETVTLATDSGEIGIWDWLPGSDTVTCDPWIYRLLGLAANTAITSAAEWIDRLHPDDRSHVATLLSEALNGQGLLEGEFRVIWPDGAVHHLRANGKVSRDAHGQPTRVIGTLLDVTEARNLATELADQHEMLRVTLRSIGDAVITTDARGHVTWLNPVAERMTGWLNQEARGLPLRHVFKIVDEVSRQPTDNPVATCLAQGKIVGLANHTVLLSKDGSEYGIEDSAAPIRNDRGEVLGVVLVFHDVTEQRRLSGEMTYRATHDVLTGLVNRGEFEVRLRRMLNTANEDQSCHALLYIDLDQFKLVNDACGHTVGDQLLQQVGRLFLEVIRARDTVARLGGDEFAVILDHCTPEQAQRVAQQICDRMEDFRFLHDGRRFRIGASIGLVPVDSRWTDTAAILQAADTSCYAAKEAGRNRVHLWFDTDHALRTRHGEMQWTTRIEQAIDEDGFVLFGQRIQPFSAAESVLHAEVLLRLTNPDGTLTLPGEFLPAAERFHLASRIDRWVLKNVLAWMRARPGSTPIGMLSVNVSGHSVGDRAFHRWAIDVLTAAGRGTCRSLCFEITETAAVTNMADALRFIEEVRRLGVRVALDDFGAGASSFGYLKSLPVDFLKIDGQFIKDILDDPLDAAAVRSFIDVAKVVGVATVAEFVDRPEVRERLRQMGVDYAQGFLIHRPEPLDNLVASLTLEALSA